MIISRSNISGILGVPFSKTFSVGEMKETLTKALPNVKEKFPQLHKALSVQKKAVDTLADQEKAIQDQAATVQDLEKKVNVGQTTLDKVTTVYQEANEKIVSKISSIPIVEGPPLDVAAAIIAAPLILAVTNAQKLLDELKDKLKKEAKKLADLATKHKEDVDKLGEQITKSIEETDATQYDTEVEQYIYT